MLHGMDPGMYSQQAERMNNHTKVPMHKYDDELSPTQAFQTVNKESTTTATSVPDLNAQLELHWLQCEVEVAIDEHLELLRENKILKDNFCERGATENELEYLYLSTEHESLLAYVMRKRKEVEACKGVIQILEGDLALTIGMTNIVDLTQHPDY